LKKNVQTILPYLLLHTSANLKKESFKIKKKIEIFQKNHEKQEIKNALKLDTGRTLPIATRGWQR